jgi:MFS transporter, FSR family, fosmidomycin resistance protein
MVAELDTIGGATLKDGILRDGETKSQSIDSNPVGAGKFQLRGVAVLSIGHGIHDLYGGFLPSLLPRLIEVLSLSTTSAGLLAIVMQLPSLLQPLIGHLSDRLSLRYFIIFAPAATGIAMSLTGVMPTYGLIVLLLLFAGLSSATIHAVGPVMISRLAGDRLGRGMGLWMVGGELGRTLGPIIAVSALAVLGLKGLPVLSLIGICATGVLYFRLKDVSARTATERQPLPWRDALKKMRPVLIPLSGVLLGRALLIAALTTYLPTFLSSEGSQLWMAGASLSILEGAGVLGALVGGSVSDRIGRRRVIAASILVPSLLMFAFLGVAGWLRIVLLVLMGFSALSSGAVIMALVQETFPQNRALANGTYMALSFALRSVGVLVLGILGDSIGLRDSYYVCCGVSLLGLPLVARLPRRHGAAGVAS